MKHTGDTGEDLPDIDIEHFNLVADESLDAETRPYFWPVVHWIVSEARRQWLDGVQDSSALLYEGGYREMCRAMGLTASDAAERVRDVLRLLHVMGLRAPGEGGLLTLHARYVPRRVPGLGPRRRKLVVIDVGLALRPDAPASRVIREFRQGKDA